MTDHDSDFIKKSRTVFLIDRGPTLEDVRDALHADANVDPVRKRDMLSALSRIEAHAGRALGAIPATATAVRELFQDLSPARMGVSDKRYRNIRSSMVAAVREYGGAPKPITTRIPLSADWKVLRDGIPVPHVRQGLNWLGAFCSHMGIAPSEVSQSTLEGLYAALESEEMVKHPRKVLKGVITNWNRCAREVAGWPRVRLETLNKTKPYTFPLESFPESFRQEVGDWVERVSNPDPLDLDAPVRPLRGDTVDARIHGIRRFASALVHRGDLLPDEITSIALLLEPERFKSACRFLIERVGGEPTESVQNLANAMRHIGKHWCKLDETTLNVLDALCKRLEPEQKTGLSDKKLARLRQFEDPRNVYKLLSFPANQIAKARTLKNPMRASKCTERALMVAILIQCCLRQKTLRMLELSDFHRVKTGSGERWLLFIPAHKVKNRRPLEFELTDETAAILDLYLETYRPVLPGCEGTYLIPGPNRGMRSKTSVQDAISSALLRETGLAINPHLIRDIIAKIIVERDPAAYGAVTTLLGHATDATTRGHYLGSETKAAGRYLDGVLRKIRSGDDDEET